ncbi:glycosyl hydrolase family 95 catalytic domain-containing protein [Pedobacter nyackensis]|uniref:glycosyl hydrolase family 95 catalytic domain-containing protein n=1 Tax=Pedobacter nyackensis TaxID=475255 RepID=UPI00292D7955|nr:DUF5703 domain-containing protein [Pedobacter nyackensis]
MKIKLLLFLVVTALSLKAQDNTMYKYLNLASSPFTVDNNYLSKHDIVYLSPTQLEAEGFPMGNGNMGGMIWNNDNGIELQINKNDLWTSLSADEGGTSILKHAARLKIDFGTPVFSWIHLNNFEGRLSLKNGEATYKASTAYTKTNIKTWLARGKNVWVVECENIPNASVLGESLMATISLERLGSRAFSGWYGGGFPKNTAVGIGKTQSLLNGRDMVIEEKGEGLHFAVVCRVIKGSNLPTLVNSHRTEQKTSHNKFTVLISVVSDRENNQPVAAAQQLLDEAEKTGIRQLNEEKNDWYKNFWSNSFVKLGNDYLENIYYLRRYLMAAGSQGEFPVAFNGGLWRWNRDVMNWVTPHHWNTQQQYWGLAAQNDCQLMLPYLNTYFKMIPYGEALAKERKAPNDALLITEAHCFSGEQVYKDRSDMKNNFTPAAQISALFWDYYAFTGDQTFLKNKAYPFMKKSANFYLDKLQWDADKKEYFLLSSLYESADIDHAKNTISDRNCIEQLFKNCIKSASLLHVDKEKIAKWKHVLAHLWKRSFQQLESSGEVISPAEEYYTTTRYSSWAWASGGSIAFPSNLIGIDDKDSQLGKAVINLVKYRKEANAHYPVPEVAARMGLGNETLEYLINGVKIHQMYPQGLMHNVTGYPDNIYNLNSIHDLLDGRYTIRSQAFFQCGMEPISNYGTTMNEMMLQSNEDKIRVFPAIPSAWDTTKIAFTLLARGAFVVSSERDNQAQVVQIGIKSLKGNHCRIQNPWSDSEKITVLQAGNGKSIKFKIDPGNVISFTTQPDVEYMIRSVVRKTPTSKTVYSGMPNPTVKHLGNRILGKLSGLNDAIK